MYFDVEIEEEAQGSFILQIDKIQNYDTFLGTLKSKNLWALELDEHDLFQVQFNASHDILLIPLNTLSEFMISKLVKIQRKFQKRMFFKQLTLKNKFTVQIFDDNGLDYQAHRSILSNESIRDKIIEGRSQINFRLKLI